MNQILGDSTPIQSHDANPLSIGQAVREAIIAEASAIKLGNVHPTAAFRDMNYSHFVKAANVIGKQIDTSLHWPIGRVVHACTCAMMQEVGCNTSLGTILLIVPLASLFARSTRYEIDSRGCENQLSNDLIRVIREIDCEESEWIYEAIRVANPGGLGSSVEHDVRGVSLPCVWEAMNVAASYDDVALQMTNGYAQVISIANRMRGFVRNGASLGDAIRRGQVELLASRPDSLIVRKLGKDQAMKITERARRLVAEHRYGSDSFEAAWHDLDNDMRDSLHRNNPGTTADLLAAAIFLTFCIPQH